MAFKTLSDKYLPTIIIQYILTALLTFDVQATIMKLARKSRKILHYFTKN